MITPTIQFADSVDFAVHKRGEQGPPAEQGFEFHSGMNRNVPSIEELVASSHVEGIR